MRNWLQTNGEWQEWATKVFQRLTNEYPLPKHENRAIWMRYLPHGQALLELEEDLTNKEAKVDLRLKVAHSYTILGKYNEAEQLCRQTLELRERVLGKENPDTLSSMNNLANVLDKQGNTKRQSRCIGRYWS
ncbi:hypothetical protein F5B19DRAFT_498713 [Rostrohypoxylon terebratum]|nr:hypothetical protein F5B19DRAFT_498713 [Rostrohypoxylon terebratum]